MVEVLPVRFKYSAIIYRPAAKFMLVKVSNAELVAFLKITVAEVEAHSWNVNPNVVVEKFQNRSFFESPTVGRQSAITALDEAIVTNPLSWVTVVALV